MATIIRRLLLEAKIQAEPAMVMPILGLAATAVGVWFWATSPGNQHRTRDVLLILEVALPAVAALMVSFALSVDNHAGFNGLLLSYPTGLAVWTLWRMCFTMFALGTAFLCIATLADSYYMPLDWTKLFRLSAPSLVVLSGLAAIGSVLTGTINGAVIPPLTYWALDMATKGSFTKKLYLFEGAYPSQSATVHDKGWLLFMGGVLWVIAITWKRQITAGQR